MADWHSSTLLSALSPAPMMHWQNLCVFYLSFCLVLNSIKCHFIHKDFKYWTYIVSLLYINIAVYPYLDVKILIIFTLPFAHLLSIFFPIQYSCFYKNALSFNFFVYFFHQLTIYSYIAYSSNCFKSFVVCDYGVVCVVSEL